MNVPPGARAVPNQPVTNQPITGTMGPQLTPNLNVESPPPAPGSQGTVGPLVPMQQGPPLEGPAATGTPYSPPLGQGQTPNFGQVSFGGTPPSPEISTPAPMTEDQAVRAIVRASIGNKSIPRRILRKAEALKEASEKLNLDFIGTESQFSKAREILKSIHKAGEPTADMPGKP